MKLNFWQWLGLILLIVGAMIWYWQRPDKPQTPPPPATTQSVG